MRKIKLNEVKKKESGDDYALDPTEKYLINLDEEMEFQLATLMSFQIMGEPPALKNYHSWLFENGFNVVQFQMLLGDQRIKHIPQILSNFS